MVPNQDHMHANQKYTSFLPVLTNYLQHLKAFVAKLAFFFDREYSEFQRPNFFRLDYISERSL